MNYKTAYRIHEVFKIDAEFGLSVGNTKLEDALCKGYVYANLYFYDEVEKEASKLRMMVQKIYDEVTTDLAVVEPMKLLMEMSTRAHRAIGDDGLDALIKEFLAEKSRHVSLVVDERERTKYFEICNAIFLELTSAFYVKTLQAAIDLEDGVKMFKFSREYVADMTPRQKVFVAPALRIVGLEHQVKMNKLEIASDFTVKYTPQDLGEHFKKQEETIKDQIKTFVQDNL